MRATLFINIDHSIGQGQNVHWTQGDACAATKTPILVNGEPMVLESAHDLWNESPFMETSFCSGISGCFSTKRKE